MSSKSSARLLFALAVLLTATFLMGVAPASAATFTVTKTADTADGSCNADCSLREAVIAANAAAGPDQIVLPPGRYVLSIPGTDENASADGDLDISGDTTVAGAGAPTTIIDGNGTVTNSRVLHILSGTTVTITGVTITGGNELGNMYPNSGGGIFIDDATQFNLFDSVVTGNRTEYWSGGLDIEGPSLIQNVTVSNNVAGEAAGGAEVETTGVTFTNVTFSGNTANEHGGAVALHDPGTIFNNVTMIGNLADADNSGGEDGGGLYVDDDATIRNSIIAGNSVGGTGTDPDCFDSGNLTSQGHNLVQVPGSCSFTATGDKTGLSPNAGPLADNGGPVPTRALLPGSPAIDAGDPGAPGSGGTACAATDARGASRTGTCDIGAYELVVCKGAVVNRLGTEGNDTLVGTTGPDGFLAFGGNDLVRGLGGKDTACLGPGKDVGAGGGGKDRLFGEGGKDRLKGQGGNDRLVGGPGKDTCIGGPGKKDRARQCEVEKTVP
jgi:CSLREA domain-containing protein